ncbi:MAG: MFS transporter [Bacteroidales bacterium]|nr:MFS transporter [Bacteroidales bacterium]MCF8388641.1 MFS transporter [Bacteroidales bacterium]MCF8398072.1 MFS transporter [Bacteroidales bacterium]
MGQNVYSKHYIYASYIAAIIVLMDLTAVNIALPTISETFSVHINEVSWILLVSMLTASSFALVAGRLIEIFNQKKIFITSLLGFSVLTFLSFLSPNLQFLVVIRFFQGFFEATIYVIGPALIRKLLPSEKQQSSYGIWMMCTGIGISMGPVIGGFLVSSLGWQYVFLINIPLCLLAVGILLRSPKIKETGKTHTILDIPGGIYSFLFLGGLIYALNMGAKKGMGQPDIIFAIIVSIFFLFAFIRKEKKTPHPVFNLRLFLKQNFLLSNLGFFIYFLVNVGSRFLRPFYFEKGRDFSTDLSGLLMMVSPLVMIFISPLAKIFSHKIRPKYLNIMGTVFLLVSMLMFSSWNNNTSLNFLIVSMILLGIGMGLYYPTNSYIGMQDLPDKSYGMGSAAMSTSKSLGKLCGVLFFAVLFSFFQQQEANQFLPDMKAFQNTFLIAAAISITALIFSFLVYERNKERTIN